MLIGVFALLTTQIGFAQYPPDLQAVLQTIKQEAFNYPSRQHEIDKLKMYLADGDFSTAKYVAEKIVEKQRNLKGAQGGGRPPDLEAVLQTIKQEAFNYPSRQYDIEKLKVYLADGDFSTAKYVAKKIVEKQRNLRGGN